jgi:long-chain fatty acid transport protein
MGIHPPTHTSARTYLVTATLATCLSSSAVWANGIYRNGIGARSMSLAGSEVAVAEDALGAMSANPAGLALLKRPELQFGGVGAYAHGSFNNAFNKNAPLNSLGGLPEAAFALPLGQGPITIGISSAPDAALSANWKYNDSPGGLGGVSYGAQRYRSEILLQRSAFGAAAKLGDKWSVGASVGLVYNKNKLQAPYIFQNTPGVAGAKTLLDLDTDGLGVNADFGIIFRPNENWQFGLNYRTETSVRSHGHASGDIGPQLALPSVPFKYDAQVNNHFPQVVTAGAAWRFHPQWRLSLQLDWVNWANTFDRLPVHLTNGDSAIINGALGSSTLDDQVPLNWRNSFVYRAGIEYAASESWRLRAGYSYGRSPVPNETLTPLTATITEHTLALGAGWQRGRYTIDFGYQLELPAERNVGTSALLSGEYSNSSVETTIHWLGVTTGMKF